MNKILICILLIISVLNAKAQTNEMKALNSYIEFANESVHTLSLMYSSLEDFNLQLNEPNFKSLKFTYQKIGDIRSAYFLPPSELLSKCIEEGKVLSINQQTTLNKDANHLYEILLTIDKYRDTIHFYTDKKLYRTDKNYITALNLLRQCAKQFDNFLIEKDNFYDVVSQIATPYKAVDASNPYVKMYENLLPTILAGRKILRTARIKDEVLLDKDHMNLFIEINKLIDHQYNNLIGFTVSSQMNGLEPQLLYNAFISESNEFYKHTQTFLEKKKQVQKWKGRFYEYHNNKFLSRYNRYGGGMIYFFNQFVEQSNVPLLRMIEEPVWFVVYPDENKKIEKDTLKIEKEIQKDKEQQAKLQKEKELAAKIEKEKKEKEIREKTLQTKVETKVDTASLEGFAANNMVLLLDVSSSMNQPEKLPVLKEAFIHLLSLMRPEDFVSIIVYTGTAEVKLKPTSATNREQITQIIEQLKSGGGSNVIKGLQLSHNVANSNYLKNGNNRVVLATDGGFEMNRRLYRSVHKLAEDNIALTIFYLNKYESPTYSAKFKELTAITKGNYFYVNKQNAKTVLLKEAQSVRK